jgi:hypothetical protein
MRLDGISTIDSGNAFLPRFIDDHNQRFAIEPASSVNKHRPIAEFDLARILCRREQRVVTKNLMFQIDDEFFALVDPYSRLNLTTGSRIDLQIHRGGNLTVRHGPMFLKPDTLAHGYATLPS